MLIRFGRILANFCKSPQSKHSVPLPDKIAECQRISFFGLPEAGGEKVTVRKFLEHVALVRDQNFEVLLGSIKQRVIFRHFLKRLPRGSPPWRADDLRLTDRDRNDPVLRLARPSELLVL